MDENARSLEDQLRDLGAHLDTGPPPDVATAVVRRLRTEPAPLAARARRRLVALVSAVLAAVLTAGLLAVPAVRAAVVDLFGLPGVIFDDKSDQPPPAGNAPAGALGNAYNLTGRTTLVAARSQLPDRVLVPPGPGAPDEVYVEGEGDRRVVHLLWRARPDLPALPGSNAGLYITTLGRDAEAFLLKMIRGVATENVTVGDRPAVWLADEHGTLLFGKDGLPDYSTDRRSGPALLVDRGDFTVRIESRLSKDEAIALAATLR
jgi:hypothetical protein